MAAAVCNEGELASCLELTAAIVFLRVVESGPALSAEVLAHKCPIHHVSSVNSVGLALETLNATTRTQIGMSCAVPIVVLRAHLLKSSDAFGDTLHEQGD